MTTEYKVWLEIEEIDESRDHYQTVDTPGGAVATFTSYEDARQFVELANETLASTTAVPARRAMTLQLLHGRRDPGADMEDWGFTAEPIHGVAWMHFTYFATITIGFVDNESMEAARRLTNWHQWDTQVLEVARFDDMIEAAGSFYGDFELFPESS